MVAGSITTAVANYLEAKGIKLTALSRSTNISESILRRSLASRKRDLRAEEFMEICNFLEKDPYDFFPLVRK